MSRPASLKDAAGKFYSVTNTTESDIKLSNGYILRPISRHPEAKLRVKELSVELWEMVGSERVAWEVVDAMIGSEGPVYVPAKPLPAEKNKALTPFQRKKVKLVEHLGNGLTIPFL